MHKLKTVSDIIKTLRSGETLGDVAVLKTSLMSDRDEVSPQMQATIALRDLTLRSIRMEDLAVLPEGTFGREYWEFMQRNKLKPLNFSDRVFDLFERFPISTRYARVHDMVHTILGFKPDLAGELGVYAVVSAQGYSKILDRAYKTGRIVTRLIRPWAWGDFNRAERRGMTLAKEARVLISEPLEDLLSKSLDEVREELVPMYFKQG